MLNMWMEISGRRFFRKATGPLAESGEFYAYD